MAKTRTPRKKATGLGDTVEQVLEATGIAKVAKFVLGEDCGCEERKKRLNELLPYRKPECLTEDEFNYLDQSQVLSNNAIKPSEQDAILKIFNRVFKKNQEPTNCATCLRDIINQLNIIYKEYKNDANTETTASGEQ